MIAIVCGAELVVAAAVGGAGLAVILRPDVALMIGLAVLLVASVFIRRRRTSRIAEQPDLASHAN